MKLTSLVVCYRLLLGVCLYAEKVSGLGVLCLVECKFNFSKVGEFVELDLSVLFLNLDKKRSHVLDSKIMLK